MQWLQNPKQKNADNLSTVRCEASRHFRNKKKECLKAKIDEPENKSMIKQDINDFNKGYQPRTNIAKDERSDLVTDCHSILARWRNRFSQLFNVQRG